MKEQAAATDKSRQPATGNAAAHELDSWMAGYGQALEGWVQSSSDAMKSAAELGQELMAFSQSRLQAHSELWKSFAACRAPSDLVECQRQFAEKAATQYLNEASSVTSRLLAIMGGATASFLRGRTSKP